ncbi:Nuclear pore glycoprotein p62 [Varanus komodoensis]|nr:Nuclear pore glycoprotein p62 [Varanus komodoensis]
MTGGFGLGNSGGLGSSVPSSVPATQPAAPSGFMFGPTTVTQPATTGGFSFGTAQIGTPSFSLTSVGSSTQQAASTGLTFGIAPAAASTATSTTAASQPATAFSLGTQPTGTGFSLLASSAANSAPTGTQNQGPALSFGTKLGGTAASSTAPATTTTNTLLGLPGPTLFASIASSSAPASSSAGGLSRVAAAPSAGFMLSLKPLTTTGTVAATSTVPTSTVAAPPVMTYAQLESLINKWSLELEDQEKHFLQQATQVNAWDRTLIENGEKITSLHREVEKVKLDQKRLDQELDFILSQQKELEDLLVPLEESVKEQSGTIYLQHADEEREKTYKLAENIDAQLKRMAQDLKDIIEHLNTSGGPADTSDPLQQICKILNAHMDSLQWIDQNSALLQRKVEEVTKVCESRRKEQERSFRITFD